VAISGHSGAQTLGGGGLRSPIASSSSGRPPGETDQDADGCATDAHHVIAVRELVADRESADEVRGVSSGGREEPSGDVGTRLRASHEQCPSDQGIAITHRSQKETSGWILGRPLRPQELRALRCNEK
jgi:hypothetical protein